jgi:hypothetical protein
MSTLGTEIYLNSWESKIMKLPGVTSLKEQTVPAGHWSQLISVLIIIKIVYKVYKIIEKTKGRNSFMI